MEDVILTIGMILGFIAIFTIMVIGWIDADEFKIK